MICMILDSYYMILSYSGLLEDMCEMCLFIAEVLKTVLLLVIALSAIQYMPEGKYCMCS